MKQQITLTFLQYYYLLKSLLFKLLLLNPQAKSVIGKRCSEDILFWLEFFVKLPPQNQIKENQPSCPKKDSRVHNRPEETFLRDEEINQNPGIAGKASERGDAPLSDSLGSSPFLKGLGKETLSQRIQNLKNSFKPQTSYNTYYWLKYKKDYILELKDRIEKGQPLLVAKSANMDESTCTALVLLWFWLYKEDANFYILGQTAKHLYYTKDGYSIFNLYKYVLNHLPHSLFNTSTDPPKPYSLKVNRKKKFFIKLTNHSNGNVIYGFSGAKRNYFPQRKQIKGVWLSDFAFHRKQQEHYQALQNISKCFIITSIPNGKGNLFYELSLNKDLDHYKLHWLLNPHYDDIWYKKIVANIDLNNVHQFLDIGFEHKIRRKRTAHITKPVKKVAKKVEIVQATTRTNRSTFFKTFTAINTPRKLYHRNAKSVYTPETYELAKKSLANGSLRVVNIPAVRDNSNDIVYLRWQKMNKLIRQNNKAQLSSVKTALTVIYHYQPDLTAYLLQQPQMPKVNDKINNNYERIHFKTLFPYAISKKEEKQNQSTLLKNNSPVPMRQEENFFNNHETKQGEALCEGLGSSPFSKGLGKDSEATERSGASLDKKTGIAGEASERGESPLCGKGDHPPKNQPSSDLNNNHQTDNRGIEKGVPPFSNTLPRVGGGLEKSLSSEINLNSNLDNNQKELDHINKLSVRKYNPSGITSEAGERGETPLYGEGYHTPQNQPSSNLDNNHEQNSGFVKGEALNELPYRGGRPGIENSLNSETNINLNSDNNQETNTTRNNAVRKATEGGVCGKGDHPPEFFEKYKKNRTYRVRSTKFNITIKPPKHKRNISTGIDGSAVERGDAPLCGQGDHPPEKPP